MARKKRLVAEDKKHKPATWVGYINVDLSAEDKKRLVTMYKDTDPTKLIDDMLGHWYKVGVQIDGEGAYKASGLGLAGCENAGRMFTGYSKSSSDAAILALWFRIAILCEWREFAPDTGEYEFG